MEKTTAIPQEVREEIETKIAQLERISADTGEKTNLINFLEYVITLPWGLQDTTSSDLANMRADWDKLQYGMKEAKDRVIEQIAVSLNKKEGFKGMILCLFGYPGVGKTFFAKNVAKILGRKTSSIALGGINDVTILRGQRKGWIGAEPGQLVKALVRAKSMNPVIILDEIDKIGGYHGEQVNAALLEILDPNQNNEFKDAYLDFPINLNNVIFIATANYLAHIPPPLLDRMEVIYIAPYSLPEKFVILKTFVFPKALADAEITPNQLAIDDQVIFDIVETTKNEAGIRTCEQLANKIVRKFLVAKMEGTIKIPEDAPFVISMENIKDFAKLDKEIAISFNPSTALIGQINIMGANDIYGTRTSLQINIVSGTGKLTTTGSLSELSKEVVSVAMGYLKTHASKYGIDEDYFEKHDFLLHRTEMARRKDGPSSGLANVICFFSAIKGLPIPQSFAVTGEVDLAGNALPIGGVKQKLTSNYQAGVTTFVLPETNRVDIAELDEEVSKNIKIHFVKNIDEVIAIFFPDYKL